MQIRIKKGFRNKRAIKVLGGEKEEDGGEDEDEDEDGDEEDENENEKKDYVGG